MTRSEAPAADPEAVRHGAKSPTAFRTTGEVAGELDLPAHVLRFWESKFPQVKPLKRGGGRRYYRPEDVDLLRRIRQCLYQQGYTIRGVQKLLRDGGLPGEEPIARPAAQTPSAALFVFEQAGDLSGDASPNQALREALEEVRHELLEIRALLGQMTPAGGSRQP